MTVTPITTELGHSLPPEESHTITLHAPGWDNAIRFRNKDMELFSKMVSMYPRFAPWGEAAQLVNAIHGKLNLPKDHGCLAFTHPDAFTAAKDYAFSSHRKPKDGKLTPSELKFRVIDIASVRLYLIIFPAAKTGGVIGMWQNNGTGISTRLAESLLKHVDDSFTIHEYSATGENDVSIDKIPEGTYLPEAEAHQKLKERIVGLLQRESIVPETANKIVPGDVYLYSTGMAAIYYLHKILTEKVQSGTTVVLGAVFHNSWHVFEEQSPGGFRHFGKCSTKEDLDELERYLEGEKVAGRRISYLFVEFPSNPILVSADLGRLRGLADKYSFPLVIDDTVGSFCNVDLLPAADVILSSLTKSFSGYANVMGGSVVLNPSSPFYTTSLKPTFTQTHHNEYSPSDAAKLLSNSEDYLPRSAILNRNASAIAALGHSYSPTGIILDVLYPPYTPTHSLYTPYTRKPTENFTPGYGCLLSIDFMDKDTAIAFYDNLHVHKGPHLGAHLTLAMPFNEMVWGSRELVDVDYHVAYGLRGEQVRVSVGLEEEGELVEVFRQGFEAAVKARGASS